MNGLVLHPSIWRKSDVLVIVTRVGYLIYVFDCFELSFKVMFDVFWTVFRLNMTYAVQQTVIEKQNREFF